MSILKYFTQNFSQNLLFFPFLALLVFIFTILFLPQLYILNNFPSISFPFLYILSCHRIFYFLITFSTPLFLLPFVILHKFKSAFYTLYTFFCKVTIIYSNFHIISAVYTSINKALTHNNCILFSRIV